MLHPKYVHFCNTREKVDVVGGYGEFRGGMVKELKGKACDGTAGAQYLPTYTVHYAKLGNRSRVLYVVRYRVERNCQKQIKTFCVSLL